MSVKRLALVVLATVGAIAATASPAFALSETADTTWMTNGKVYALAQSGNTLYVGGKYAQLVSPDGATKIKVKSLGRLDATTGNGIAGWGPKITQDGKAGTVRALAVSLSCSYSPYCTARPRISSGAMVTSTSSRTRARRDHDPLRPFGRWIGGFTIRKPS